MIELELRVFHSNPIAQDGRTFMLWIYPINDERYPEGYPIGNRIRYTKDEAVKEASEISKALGIRNSVTKDCECFRMWKEVKA